MRITSAIIVGASIVIGSYLLSGGIYRVKSVNELVAHRLNILSGEIAFCIATEGCKDFAEADEPNHEPRQTPQPSHTNEWPLYPFSLYRGLEAYEKIGDQELAKSVLDRYNKESGLSVSEAAFYEVIGYQQ